MRLKFEVQVSLIQNFGSNPRPPSLDPITKWQNANDVVLAHKWDAYK